MMLKETVKIKLMLRQYSLFNLVTMQSFSSGKRKKLVGIGYGNRRVKKAKHVGGVTKTDNSSGIVII